MTKIIHRLATLLILATLALSACTLPSNVTVPTATQVGPQLIYTAAAQTVAAQLTQAASGQVPTLQPPTLEVKPTDTAQPQVPTETPLPPTQAPTNTPAPTSTPVPPTPKPVPCNRMEYIKDVNYPDNTEFNPGEEFDKIWRLRNTGSCTWDSSYVIIFDHGDSMDASPSSLVTNGKVLPGDTVDVKVGMTAPEDPGTYQGFWKLRDGKGNVFGYGEASKAFWVKIVVVAEVTFDFLKNAKYADWRNATDDITFGDKDNDDPGVAAYGYDIKLEDGKTYEKVLGTYPERVDDGIITGLYDEYTVKNGDHFRATVGFKADCENGKVKFQLYYKVGGTTTMLKEWKKTCSGELMTIEYNLSSLKGQTVRFMLGVFADGSYKNDKAIWVDPRIQR